MSRPKPPGPAGPDLRQVHLGRLGLRIATRMVLEHRGRVGNVAELVELLAPTESRRHVEGFTEEMESEARSALARFLQQGKDGGS